MKRCHDAFVTVEAVATTADHHSNVLTCYSFKMIRTLSTDNVISCADH